MVLISWFGRNKPENPVADSAKIQALIANLPADDSAEALQEIAKQLQEMHRLAELKLEQRFRNLDLLDGASRTHERALLLEYLATPRHKKSHEQKLWSSAHDFWRELGEGYQRCFREAEKAGAAAKATLPIFVGRALRALRQQLRWALLRYESSEPRVWTDMARLYLFAEEKGFTAEPIAVYPGSSGSGTAKQEFLKALMLAASSTDSLQPVAQDLATRLVAHFAGMFVITDQADEVCTHWIDLASPKIPVRLVRQPPKSASVRYIGAGAGLHELEQLRAHIAYTRSLPEGLDLNGAYDDDTVLALLKHLEQDWAGKTQSRRFERRKAAGRVTVVPGLKEIIESLEFAYNDSLDFTHRQTAESWIVEDMSEGGYGAVIPSVAGDWVEVGSLIGVEGETFRDWRVGVIRRVARTEQQQQRVGVHLLTQASALVSLRRPSAATAGKAPAPRPAVLISPKPEGQKEVDIALAKGVFDANENLEMLIGGEIYLLRPLETIERGPHYEVVRFSILRAVH
jgi:hypothetical protein